MKINLFILFCCCAVLNAVYANGQIITTIAGNGTFGQSGDGGHATAASFFGVFGVAKDHYGNIYISTIKNGGTFGPWGAKVRKVDIAGIVTTFAGTDTFGFYGDAGPATAAWLKNPDQVAFDKKGNVYIADMLGNQRVRKVDPSGIITTFAGNGSSTVSGDGGPATSAGLGSGGGICSDSIGNIYIAAGYKIRKVDTFGIISTFAGSGSTTYGGDGGPATAAGINPTGQIIIDKYGNMYFADGNNRIRKISSTGIITLVAGASSSGYSGDGGPATAALLHNVTGVAVDNCGNIYIGDTWNHRVRMVDGNGIITTIAGNGHGTGTGIGGFGGDGGLATAAELNGPNFLWVDDSNSIYISDCNNARIRYIHMDSCIRVSNVGIPVTSMQERSLNIFPNPSYGSFTLHLSSTANAQAHITITDLTGRVIKELHCTTNKDTEIRMERVGLYFVTAEVNGERYVQKVVVQ